MYPLKSSIQAYDWGPVDAISHLLGFEPTGGPEAELWMGSHPKSPCRIVTKDGERSLLSEIARSKSELLGDRVLRTGSDTLPFLLKILAAERGLSIQAHPSLDQAAEGFDREERSGIPADAPNRNYRDRNHKPEIICALTEFWALCGFRSSDEIFSRFERYRSKLATDAVKALSADRSSGRLIGVDVQGPGSLPLRRFLATLLSANESERLGCLKEILAENDRSVESEWVLRLAHQFPGDIGAIAPLFLNLIRLSPEEALYLDSGVLHAYLFGTGIELMASSDNVLRGGLTSKQIDADELQKVVLFESAIPSILAPQPSKSGITTYVTPSPEFELSRIDLSPYRKIAGVVNEAPSIVLCLSGGTRIASSSGETVMKGGDAVYLLPGEDFEASGDAKLFRATMPSER